MGLADRWAEFIYKLATSKNRLKIIATPLGLVFWFGLGVLLVFASLWLDNILPVRLTLPAPVGISLSVLLLVIGVALCFWTIYNFVKAKGSPVPINPPKRLVTTGLYSRVRNPMVSGWIVMMFGVGVRLDSISLIFIFTPLFLLLNILYLKTIEEKEMEKKFGQEYIEYRESVPMFLPRFRRK